MANGHFSGFASQKKRLKSVATGIPFEHLESIASKSVQTILFSFHKLILLILIYQMIFTALCRSDYIFMKFYAGGNIDKLPDANLKNSGIFY
ncbi:MAG: hypothetical protein A2X59_07270 [Nitrospirae bacterium GWC2_42_7]|nr:MAG: hypothetical protein A2X59_07270 [Nitrospirae bacterium GWC2_42_7]